MVNYEEAIKKPFTDFVKLIIGIIVSAIPVANLVSYGFGIECSGVGKNKPSKNMPEWGEFVDYFVKGLLALLVIIVYLIPAILVFAAAAGTAVNAAVGALSAVLPADFLTSLMAGELSDAQITSMFSQNWMVMLPAILSSAPIFLVGFALMIVALYVSPVAVLNFIKTKKVGKAFDFGYVLKRAFSTDYFTVWIVSSIITVILGAVTAWIPVIGGAIASFISGVISWSLYGQVLREKK